MVKRADFERSMTKKNCSRKRSMSEKAQTAKEALT